MTMDIQQKIWCHLEKKQPWIITEWVLRFIALEVMAVKVNMRVRNDTGTRRLFGIGIADVGTDKG